MIHAPVLLPDSTAEAALDAQGAIATDLAAFQAMRPTCASFGMTHVLEAFQPAHQLGFAYSFSQGLDSVVVSLLHRNGASLMAAMEEGSPWELLANLAGITLADLTTAPAQGLHIPESAASPEPSPAAAPAPAEPEPDEFADADLMGEGVPETPVLPEDRAALSEADRETCVALIRALTAEQRKSFTVAFRSHFNVDKASRTIAPHIAQVQHQKFIQSFVDELELSGAAA